MLEVGHGSFTVIGCLGAPAAISRLAEAAQLSIEIAEDEVLLLLPHGDEAASADFSCQLSLDLTSAFSVWVISGDDRAEAFRRLSAIDISDGGVTQGLVAELPAKVIAREDTFLVIVSSVLAHAFHERVRTACADLLEEQVYA